MMDGESHSDTWPDIQIQNPHVTVAHEATVGRISDDQLFYMGSRGFTEDEAAAMIVNGFIEPVTKELPMEYAVELNRLIQLEMVGSSAKARSACERLLTPSLRRCSPRVCRGSNAGRAAGEHHHSAGSRCWWSSGTSAGPTRCARCPT